MTEHYDQPCAKLGNRELDRTEYEVVRVIAGDPHDEQVAEPLRKDEVRDYARVGAREHHRVRRLSRDEQVPLLLERVELRRFGGLEFPVTGDEARERLAGSNGFPLRQRLSLSSAALTRPQRGRCRRRRSFSKRSSPA